MVKIFLTDMDGTLTDGGRYLGPSGEELKKFYIPDGMGMVGLKKLGIKTGIVTSETGELVQLRARQLNLDFVVTGAKNKWADIQNILQQTGLAASDLAYIGDDINDHKALVHAGLRACPADAQPIIKKIPGMTVMSSRGGEGAVREFINLLVGEEALLRSWESNV